MRIVHGAEPTPETAPPTIVRERIEHHYHEANVWWVVTMSMFGGLIGGTLGAGLVELAMRFIK
jgi:hypothetical protein